MDELDAVEVVDVTAELVGERREEWRDGFDNGVREGVRRLVGAQESRKEPTQGQAALQQIGLELTVLRLVTDATSAVAERRELELAMWKAEAELWRGECERISAEYTEFVSAVRRMGR